jgi:hypothetical protein
VFTERSRHIDLAAAESSAETNRFDWVSLANHIMIVCEFHREAYLGDFSRGPLSKGCSQEASHLLTTRCLGQVYC